MRVLFVYKTVEWLGVEYLSAALKEAGHETDLAFESGLDGTFYFKAKKRDHKGILDKIKEYKPDLILFSSTTNLFPWVKEVASLIKENFKIPIVVGGVHSTIQPEKTIHNKNVDIICVGEGELAIVELINKMEKGENYYDTKNFWFKTKKGIIKNEVRPLISNLDTLPFPDKNIFYKYGAFIKRAYVIAGRGCPYQCSYCINHQLQAIYKGKCKNFVRMRSVDNVIEELFLYKKIYGIKSVVFCDETFILDREWILEFSKKYKKEINLPFQCMVRANLVTDEIIKALKYAGCKYVSMGLESGSLRVRQDILNRCMLDSHITNAVKVLNKYRIGFLTFNIFGIPGETLEEMTETMTLNLKIRPYSVDTYIFYPFPGVDLMKNALKQGYLTREAVILLENGQGSYQSESILNHPFKNEAYNMKVVLPLLNRLPRLFHSYFVNKWVKKKHSNFVLNFITYASIPLRSPWEMRERIKEQLSMMSPIIRFVLRRV